MARCTIMRLFIAIALPADLKMTLGQLRVEIQGARWVPAEQIHLTLAFLGEVAEPEVERLTRALAGIQTNEFRLCFSGTGCFPNRHRPRVLWIGLEPHARLQELAGKVREAVIDCGIAQEERPFSPHITLARLKLIEPGGAYTFLDQPLKQKPAPFFVREFILFQSRLTQQGAVHLPVKSFPLLSAAAGRV